MGFLSNLLRKSIENPLNSENIPLFQDFVFFSRFFSISKNKIFFRKNIFKIRILSRIPKIILRKPYDEPKHTKSDFQPSEQKSALFIGKSKI